MTDSEYEIADHLGLLAAVLAALVAVFVGPLEAAAALFLYWLVGPERARTGAADRPSAE